MRPRPGSSGNTEQGGGEMIEELSQRRSIDQLWCGSLERRIGAFVHAGGAKEQTAAIAGLEIGRRDPPPRRYLDAIQITPPDPGQHVYDVEAFDDNRPRAEQQVEIDARENLVDLRRRPSQGRLRGARGGFPQRFPPSRGGPRPFTSPYSHKTIRGWETSVAAA